MKQPLPFWAAALLLVLHQAASAQVSCSSEGQAAPTTLLERFISADCEACWADAHATLPPPGAVALDWLVPGTMGDDAPLSAAARHDGLDRKQARARAVPPTIPLPPPLPLRVARGPMLGGYVGTSIALQSAHEAAYGPLTAWLALVETIPAGSDGTAVERNLVRNTLVLDWSTPGEHSEIRPLSVPAGAQAARLRVIGWVEDASARVVAMAQSVCAPEDD
ncbi:MAG: hypothetical protein ABI410_03395 [Rhodoferax sp.]|uniref:hypothetical protein n=1 Tax=Rhodoferax sp. TaxID=50421 RepID=UPI0032640CBF